MTEQSVCLGCHVQPLWWNNFVTNPYTPEAAPAPAADAGLTDNERRVLYHLATAWNEFSVMGRKCSADDQEFIDAIHKAQQLIALRVARRANPDIWAQGSVKLTELAEITQEILS